MQQYDYKAVDGRIVARINGRNYLLETSLPFSLGAGPLLLDGRRIETTSEVLGLNVEDLSPQMGMELDGILGGNVSDQFVVNVKPQDHQLVFDDYLADYPIDIEVENMGGLAVMNQTINGMRVKGALDLGGTMSLVTQDMVGDLKPVDYQTEVFWFIGKREVAIHYLPVMIDRKIIHLRFGVMPSEIESWLEMANIRASIGSELLQHYAVSLALQEGSLMLEPLQ
jgi:hypothetical protein